MRNNKLITMKKMYIAPTVEVVNIDMVSMIATSNPVDSNLPGGGGSGGNSQGGMDADGNRHRGEWGNLWK